MRIEKITASDFLPFQDLTIEFPIPCLEPDAEANGEIHLLLGANGTGKSRLLSAIAAGMGNPQPMTNRMGEVSLPHFACRIHTNQGPIDLNSGGGANTPRRDELAFAYSGARYLVDSKVAQMQSVAPPTVEERLAFERTSAYAQKLAQALFNLKQDAAQDFMNRGGVPLPLEQLPRYEKIITALETKISRALCHISGKPAGSFTFRASTRPSPGIQAEWNGKLLQFNQLPDGLRMVIGWLVDIAVMTDLLRPGSPDPLSESMIILLDEPETHLHPAWQRKIIPLAQELLPNAQFIIATHSPFLVMSVNEGWIHRLELQADGTVRALEPKPAEKGDSYIHVMREMMGVEEQYDDESEKIMADFRAAKERAMAGEQRAEREALDLLGQLALRGEELGWIARAEKEQLIEELRDPVPA